jgi:hypothetical protein
MEHSRVRPKPTWDTQEAILNNMLSSTELSEAQPLESGNVIT